MKVLLTVEPFDRLGTEGRRFFDIYNRRSLIKEVKEWHRATGGKAIQVEEWSHGNYYGEPTARWVYKGEEK